MDSADAVKVDVPEKADGFFKYILSFPDSAKHDVENMIQYILYAIIPICILYWAILNFVPTYDPTKTYVENLAESLLQYGIIIIGCWFIDRIVRYFPTWSGKNYHDFNYTFIIPFILSELNTRTNVGEKLASFIDTIVGSVHKKTSSSNQREGLSTTHVDHDTSLALGPPPPQATSVNKSGGDVSYAPPTRDSTGFPSDTPDFNKFYQHDTTKLQDTNSLGQIQMPTEPMAANDSLGGFSSW